MSSSHRATGERKICCCLLVYISKATFFFRRLKFRVKSRKIRDSKIVFFLISKEGGTEESDVK